MRVSHFETVPISQKYFRNTPLNVADSDSMRIDTNENRVKAAHQVDRYAVIGDSSFDVGSIRLSGSEVDVTGRSMRLLAVTPDHHIRSQTWVSRDGLVRCRYYNWVTGTYEWEESIKQVDERGLLSVGTVTCGGQQMRMRPERAIAIAWVNIPGHLIHEPARAVLINPSDSICASNVGWLSRRHVRLPRRWHTSCIPPPMSESNSDDEGVGDGNGEGGHGGSGTGCDDGSGGDDGGGGVGGQGRRRSASRTGSGADGGGRYGLATIMPTTAEDGAEDDT